MAAGALAAVLGGTPAQAENAAEIGMEHNLGMTCDPVGGAGANPLHRTQRHGRHQGHQRRAPALRGDGQHVVSLDQVIKTMVQTGADMMSKYKETSRGGLAVNVVECWRKSPLGLSHCCAWGPARGAPGLGCASFIRRGCVRGMDD